MTSLFKHFPAKPAAPECQNAFTILCNAHDAASSFLDIFEQVRKARAAKGAPTDEEQDLLRACLVFATAGLDSMAKQLIRDALPKVLDRHDGAAAMFAQHIERNILKDGEDAGRATLAKVLSDPSPRARLVSHLVDSLTAGSLQSHEELMRAGSHFDIPSKKLIADVDPVRKIFRARNEIVHEMDINFSAVNRNRRSRTKAQMTEFTNEIFQLAANLLFEVDSRCT